MPRVLTFCLLILGLAIAGLVGAAPHQAAYAQTVDLRVGKPPDVDLFESRLRKGVSTKAEVRALLGKPNGRGGVLSSLEPDRPRDMWLYSSTSGSLIGVEGGVARMHLEQQMLMVFFVDGVLDGFWWHEFAEPATVSAKSGG